MWEAESGTMASVLIVESEGGDVFIVEDKQSEPMVEKILKTENSPRSARKHRQTLKVEPREASPDEMKSDFRVEEQDEEEMEISDMVVEEYLDEYFEDVAQPVFISLPDDANNEDDIVFSLRRVKGDDQKSVSEVKNETLPEAILDHQYMVTSYISDDEDDDDDSEEEQLVRVKVKIERKSNLSLSAADEFPIKHKLRQLTGKAACKYCDTIFKSKESLRLHNCPYLQCDPKNFICRICKKELSRKTFSNHLHETLDCQYCGKQFVNPRNMKTHIKRAHKDEKFVPPNLLNRSVFLSVLNDAESRDESNEPSLDASTGLMSVAYEQRRKKYPRKTGRFECDLCGRVFTTLRSLKIHMDLHTNSHRFVCQICGEKYTTHTGIIKHACLNKKRRRPMVDFRIFDVRHCKFCGLSFENFEENKAHLCTCQFEENPKLFRCRFCSIIMSKNSYNKHMGRHVEPEKEYICSYCNKKLSDQVGLNIHLTTHTGNKPFKCLYENCEKSFINKQLLVRHSRFHGAEIPVYTCVICNKEVASKYHLKTHMKIHTDTFECQLCKHECDGRESLKDHYQDMHEPFQCEQCDKSFTLPRYLKMHEKLHTPSDPKPYKCDFCISNKSFGKAALLLNHVYKTHNDSFAEWKENHPEIFK